MSGNIVKFLKVVLSKADCIYTWRLSCSCLVLISYILQVNSSHKFNNISKHTTTPTFTWIMSHLSWFVCVTERLMTRLMKMRGCWRKSLEKYMARHPLLYKVRSREVCSMTMGAPRILRFDWTRPMNRTDRAGPKTFRSGLRFTVLGQIGFQSSPSFVSPVRFLDRSKPFSICSILGYDATTIVFGLQLIVSC